jgi:RNA polymerase sigma-70 factor (ECF subfamily)
MDDSQATRVSLLLRLQGSGDRQAWSDFVDLYSPIVYGFARRQGLQDADAADLVQEVLLSVSKSIRHYDRQRGLFRHWLMAVVRNRLSDFRQGNARQASGSGDTEVLKQLEQVPSGEDAERAWDEEYARSVFRFAAVRVRDEFERSTWEAFWQTSVDGKSTREVAQTLGLSEGAVYIAKCRVLAQVKAQVKALEE